MGETDKVWKMNEEKSPLSSIFEMEGFTAFESPVRADIVREVKRRVDMEQFTDEEVDRAVDSLLVMNVVEMDILLREQDKHCTRCGNCCRTNFPIDFEKKDLKAASEYLGIPYKKLKRRLRVRHSGKAGLWWAPGKPCPLLEGKNDCTIFPVRPLACKAYPFGKTVSQTMRGKKPEVIGAEECDAVKGLMVYMAVGRITAEKLWEMGELQSQKEEVDGQT